MSKQRFRCVFSPQMTTIGLLVIEKEGRYCIFTLLSFYGFDLILLMFYCPTISLKIRHINSQSVRFTLLSLQSLCIRFVWFVCLLFNDRHSWNPLSSQKGSTSVYRSNFIPPISTGRIRSSVSPAWFVTNSLFRYSFLFSGYRSSGSWFIPPWGIWYTFYFSVLPSS